MSASAIVLMVLVQTAVTIITVYYFYKVLKTPPKPEPDSFVENDAEPR